MEYGLGAGGHVWGQTFYFSVQRWKSTELSTISCGQSSHYLQKHWLYKQKHFSDLSWGIRFIQTEKRRKHQRATTPERRLSWEVEFEITNPYCFLTLNIHLDHLRDIFTLTLAGFSVISLHKHISKCLGVYAPDALPIHRGSRQMKVRTLMLLYPNLNNVSSSHSQGYFLCQFVLLPAWTLHTV